MCTLIASIRQYARFPVVIAANRDEVLDRPSSPPRLWPGRPRVLAPVDERKGGSWLGLNEHGLFVGITNRFGAPRHEDRASRGELVIRALRAPDVDALHRELATADPRTWNAFHLFYADTSGAAAVTWSDGERLHQERRGPGLHVLSERSFGAADLRREEQIRRNWPPPTAPGEPDLSALTAILSQHDANDPLNMTCVHVPAFNYGTRSSCVLRLAHRLSDSHLDWAEGSPCTHPYRSFDAQVQALCLTAGNV